jgi:hypothetical protein
MDTKQKIEVMQAYLDGKVIQTRDVGFINWSDFSLNREPNWFFDKIDYRIKPEPKHRQLKPEELIALKGKWLKNKTDSIIAMVTGIDSEEGCVNMLGIWWSIKELHESWTYEGGRPVGKIED